MMASDSKVGGTAGLPPGKSSGLPSKLQQLSATWLATPWRSSRTRASWSRTRNLESVLSSWSRRGAPQKKGCGVRPDEIRQEIKRLEDERLRLAPEVMGGDPAAVAEDRRLEERIRGCLVRVRVRIVLYALFYEKDVS